MYCASVSLSKVLAFPFMVATATETVFLRQELCTAASRRLAVFGAVRAKAECGAVER